MRTMAGWLIALMLVLFPADRLGAQEMGSPEPQQEAIGPTPPRLSFVDGQVSFFRPGAQEWTPAQVNMPLSPGDRLQTGSPGNLEIQIGDRAFARGWANTRIELTNQEPDHLQINLTAGHVAFDLRTLEPGQTIELDTPNGAFTVERSGYYRIEVDGETTTFASRRGGRASLTPASGGSIAIAASEQVVVTGTDAPQIASYAAPELDAWDRWNYARTDDQVEAVSARYLPSGVYGRTTSISTATGARCPSYGAVWVPRGVGVDWAPYSTGRWIYDPYYAWTWVDTRAVGLGALSLRPLGARRAFWGWAPGPRRQPVYSPALVAFFGGSYGRRRLVRSAPVVGWVPLGWGEPCVPWWGRPGSVAGRRGTVGAVPAS